MKYAHILMAVASELWAIEEEKMQAIISFLALQAGGDKLSSEELQARITRDRERDVLGGERCAVVPEQRRPQAERVTKAVRRHLP